MQLLKENFQFAIITLLWVIAGILFDQSAMVLVPLLMLLFRNKEYYSEIVMTQLVINFLSDNRHAEFNFAVISKDIILLTVCSLVLINPKNFPNKSKLAYVFMPFFVLAFLISLKNPAPWHSFQKTLSFFMMLTFVPTYFIRQLNVEGPVFLRKVISIGTLLNLTGLAMIVIFERDWTFIEGGRYNGLLGNPNGIGIWSTVFFLLVAVSLHHYPGLLNKQEKYIVYGSILLSVLLSGSRNCIFSIGIYLFFSRFYRISPWIGFAMVIGLAVIFQIINENLPFILRGLGLEQYFRLDTLREGSGRLVAWGFAWTEINKDNFMFGRGFAFEEWLFFINQEWLNYLGHQGGVHNTYLAIWLNTGIVGLVLYLIGFFSNFIKAARNSPVAFPVMFAILFSITFESWFQASLNPFTIVALLVITIMQYAQPASTEEKGTVPVL